MVSVAPTSNRRSSTLLDSFTAFLIAVAPFSSLYVATSRAPFEVICFANSKPIPRVAPTRSTHESELMGFRHGCSSLGIVPGGTEIEEYPAFAVDEDEDDGDEPPVEILVIAAGSEPLLLRRSEKEMESMEQRRNKAKKEEEDVFIYEHSNTMRCEDCVVPRSYS